MSTKIYNGFKFKIKDITELHRSMNILRTEFNNIRDGMMLDQMTEDCFSLFDRRTISPDLFDEPVMRKVVNETYARQEEVRIKQVRDPSVDFSFEICVYPHNGEFYGQFFTEQRTLTEMLKKKCYFEDFSYWNNVDEPEGVTKEEWNNRERVWEEILSDSNYIPSRAGFTYEIVPLSGYVNIDAQKIIDNAPGIIVRAERIAKDNIYKKYAANRKINATNVMKVYGGFVEHLSTEKGASELKLETEFVAKQLKLVLDKNDLVR